MAEAAAAVLPRTSTVYRCHTRSACRRDAVTRTRTSGPDLTDGPQDRCLSSRNRGAAQTVGHGKRYRRMQTVTEKLRLGAQMRVAREHPFGVVVRTPSHS